MHIHSQLRQVYSIGTLLCSLVFNHEDDHPPDDEHGYEGMVDDDEEEEGDGMSDASRNWAKDGVGPLQRGRRHLGAMHDSCN